MRNSTHSLSMIASEMADDDSGEGQYKQVAGCSGESGFVCCSKFTG